MLILYSHLSSITYIFVTLLTLYYISVFLYWL